MLKSLIKGVYIQWYKQRKKELPQNSTYSMFYI